MIHMHRLYTKDDIYVPLEDNRFWRAFKIGVYVGYGKLPKYEVTCYGYTHPNRVVVMDQELMRSRMREISEHELKKFYEHECEVQPNS